MLAVTGVIALMFGLLGYGGQLISSIDFQLAQRLGLQEKDEDTEPLYRRLELNTARWDLAVLWTLPVAGLLIILDHSWWPYLALISGGVFVDAGGREIAKLLGLRRQGVRVGGGSELRLALGFLTVMIVTGLWVAVYGLLEFA